MNYLHLLTEPMVRQAAPPPTTRECLDLLDLRPGHLGRLPFLGGDCTAGSENELQVAVRGGRGDVDLPLTIEQSSYFANLTHRIRTGETAPRVARQLTDYLENNPSGLWENSWVRFPHDRLCDYSRAVFSHDLRLDKGDCQSSFRSDAKRFFVKAKGEDLLRLPISYLVKLALADYMGRHLPPDRELWRTGERLQTHFLNDNTSPETFSLRVERPTKAVGNGAIVAREAARRFLLTHLLVDYANETFGLHERGQHALIFFSPHPPVRQKQLNSCVSDAFYRELFMSPCLSGWDQGEAKHRYMALCHEVLSRSHLNAVAKLREAGVIVRDLVVMPNTSNISLANNGTHVSLGSDLLTNRMADPGSGFGARHEKWLGDLATKVVEHFLPLFVGTYTAAPYRLDFADMHPERTLGFLSHELDSTHLRMIWRRWRKKARNRLLGHPLTPFGPEFLDRWLSRLLGLGGDLVPDFRLVDYLVALPSTPSSPALDGTLGNTERLKGDLDSLGVFDQRMSFYALFRQRLFASMGFAGFEARYYSLFPNLLDDMAQAVNLQMLVTSLAFKYIANRQVDHADIPDTPFAESERRQIFFATAVGVPTFYVRRDTANRFLLGIVKRARSVRYSQRYKGYLRVTVDEYRRALLDILREDAADLADANGMEDTLADLAERVLAPTSHGATAKIAGRILGGSGKRHWQECSATEFNLAAEAYYREETRKTCLREGFEALRHELSTDAPRFAELAGDIQDLDSSWEADLLADQLPPQRLLHLIRLLLAVETPPLAVRQNTLEHAV